MGIIMTTKLSARFNAEVYASVMNKMGLGSNSVTAELGQIAQSRSQEPSSMTRDPVAIHTGGRLFGPDLGAN
jgi:hypothetical protein